MVSKFSGEGGGRSAGVAGDLACNRRALLAGLGCGVLLAGVPAGMAEGISAGAGAAGMPTPRGGGLAFFGDRPMVDPSGKLPAYRPPAGFRGAGALASADDAQVRYVLPFMT